MRFEPRPSGTIRPEVDEESCDKARTNIKEVILSPDGPPSEVDISDDYTVSKEEFLGNDYATLDWKHRTDVFNIIHAIQKYAEDRTRRRPFNIIMSAEPGSGKSHLVKCIANSYQLKRYRASAIDCNMTSLQSFEDLIQPLDAVRNLKILDQLPILFLDEFDSRKDMYAKLLPLMWDGEVHIGQRNLKLGKLVIILAGSEDKVKTAMEKAKSMECCAISGENKFPEDKLPDLISRINGGELKIPPLYVEGDDEGNQNRNAEKVCMTISLLQARFGQKIELIAWALLKFVAITRFRYGVRSICNLIDLVSPVNDEKYGKETEKDIQINLARLQQLPLNSVDELKESSLAYHIVSKGGPEEIVTRWNKCKKCSTLVRVEPSW